MGLLLVFSSCSKLDFDYTPENDNITFASSTGRYALDGKDIVVTIQRGVVNKAITVNVTLTDVNKVYTLKTPTVSFAEGANSADVIISYNSAALKPVINYGFKLSFNEAQVAISGTNEFIATASMPLVYKDYGTISFTSGVVLQNFGVKTSDYKLQKADKTDNYYKIVNMYDSGKDMEFNVSGNLANITAPELTKNKYFGTALFAEFKLAGTYPQYGSFVAWVDPDQGGGEVAGATATGKMVVGTELALSVFYTHDAGYLKSASGSYWWWDTFTVTKVN